MADVRDVQKLQPDIENDPVTKDHISFKQSFDMSFWLSLVPVLAAAHRVKNVDLGNNQRFKDECCKKMARNFSKVAGSTKMVVYGQGGCFSKQKTRMQNLTDYKVISSSAYSVMIIADYPPYTTKKVDKMAKKYNLKTPT